MMLHEICDDCGSATTANLSHQCIDQNERNKQYYLQNKYPRFVDWRPDKHARVFIELELMAQWSTCQRGRVASVLVNIDGVILVPARNGTPYGQPTCSDLGANPNQRCVFCVHSEKNVINHAARLGVRTQGHNLYTLKRPCLGCSNDIVQSGIAHVYYREDYDTDEQKDYVMDMFFAAGIGIAQIEPTRVEVLFSEMLEEWRSIWDSG